MVTDPPNRLCYLDHAAATPLLPEVIEAMQATAGVFGNPSSPHAAGRNARRLLEEARERILSALSGCHTATRASRLLFTSGATEANQMAVAGLTLPDGSHPALLISPRDHAATALAAGQLQAAGRRLTILPLDACGRLDRGALGQALAGGTAAVLSTTLACSQTGTLEDVAEIAAGYPELQIHVDAVQAVGRIPLSREQLGASTIALAAHKLGGPHGIGGLLLGEETSVQPLLQGSQERGLRGGTEPVTLAVGFAVALEIAVERQEKEAARLAHLRDRCERGILEAARSAGIDAVVFGASAARVPHISIVALPGRDRQATVIAADLAGVCLASGTACTSGSSEPAAALVAAGLPQSLVDSAIRISLGWSTTEEEIDHAVHVLRTQVFCRPR